MNTRDGIQTVLIIPEPVTISHVVRPWMTGRELKRRGYRVYCALSGRYRSLVESDGIPCVDLFSIPPEEALHNVKHNKISFTETVLKRYIDAETRLFRTLKPDIVVGDMRLSLKISCRRMNIPFVSLLNAYHTYYYSGEHRFPDTLWLSKILPGRMQKRLFRTAMKLQDRYFGAPFRALSGGRISRFSEAILSDRLNLLCDVPELFPCRNLPENTRYVGPFVWAPDQPLPPWIDALAADRPTVYVTSGTSGTGGDMQRILTALSAGGYQVILSTGGASAPELPPRAFAAGFLPALKLMERLRVVCTISHGGNGTIYQSLSRGIPVIAIPGFYDQEWNADRVAALGLGARVEGWDGERLLALVEFLRNDPKTQSNLLQLQQRIAAMNAPVSAADLIARFCPPC